MQVEPIKPVLKAPGSMLLKLRYDGPLSNFAFKVNLRRYNEGGRGGVVKWLSESAMYTEAGAYTRSLFSST